MSTYPIKPSDGASFRDDRASIPPSDYIRDLLEKKLSELEIQRGLLRAKENKEENNSAGDFINLKIEQIKKLIGYAEIKNNPENTTENNI